MIFSSHAFLQQIDICKCLVIIWQICDVPGEFQDDGNPILNQIVLHI